MEDVEDDRFCRGSVESLGVVDQDGQAWVGSPQLAQSHPVSGRDEVEIPYAAQPAQRRVPGRDHCRRVPRGGQLSRQRRQGGGASAAGTADDDDPAALTVGVEADRARVVGPQTDADPIASGPRQLVPTHRGWKWGDAPGQPCRVEVRRRFELLGDARCRAGLAVVRQPGPDVGELDVAARRHVDRPAGAAMSVHLGRREPGKGEVERVGHRQDEALLHVAGESARDDGAAAGDDESEPGGQAVTSQPEQRFGWGSVVDVLEGALDRLPPVDEEDHERVPVGCRVDRLAGDVRAQTGNDACGDARLGGARDRPDVGQRCEVPKWARGALDDVEVEVLR
jgi:hypothetical protein